MSLTPSNMLPLGTKAPDFQLVDTKTGKIEMLSTLKSDIATVIMFICNHCPYVKHVERQLVKLSNDYIPKDISFIAISSNDIENYPDDAPEKMKENALDLGYPFSYLFDETQEVAKTYDAACTPDFYIFDKDMQCVYRGQLDGSRPGNNIPVTGDDIRSALNNILNDKPVESHQVQSMGCNIKWKT